jgi:transcriptional regulator with PAS, ATPase and Fis domain
MRQVLELASRVATVDSTVLISGETGVGKERLARWLHDTSRRAGRPFLAVNCGAFSDTLLESELFGHTRGAFTGAVAERAGVFEAAEGGTLLLDEVGEMSPAMQIRLLRVVQERAVRRLGETRVRPLDVRLIAATNRDIEELVTRNQFRPDLWYRLRVIELRIPPLRERSEDIHGVAVDLLQLTAQRLKRPVAGFTSRALDRLTAYPWPGNVRELEHAIEHACAVATSHQIDLDDLPAAVRGPAPDDSEPRHPLVDREREYIRSVVERHHGRRRLAAAELGISLSTLNRRLRRVPAASSPRQTRF